MKKIFLYTLFVFSFAACKDKDGDVNFFSLEDDKQLGLQSSLEIENNPQQYPILSASQYPQAYQHIQRITDNILNSGKVQYRNEFAWKVKIIRDDSTLNAFCTPGGYIFVYTGIIKYLDNEAQLAGVMGHEIAHADHRHSTDQLTKQYGLSLLLQVVLGNNPGALAQIAANLALLKYSREHETESDYYSVVYLYSTEYQPNGAGAFFQKLLDAGQSGNTPVFLSTHPSPSNRVQNIDAVWQKLGGKNGQTFQSRYQDFKNSLP